MKGAAASAPHTTPLLDALLEETSRTFAVTIPLLPEPTRAEVTVAYLLFRVADTLEDAERWDGARKVEELSRLARLLRRPAAAEASSLARRWSADPPCDHPGYLRLLERLPEVVATAGRLSVEPRRLIRRHTLRTIEGMAGFVAREEHGVLQLRDVDDLRAYCYAVAGIVGEMLTELFLHAFAVVRPAAGDLRGDAAHFGEALQLVNILKDADADRRHGRRYLPAGLSRSAVFELARQDLVIAGRYCGRLEGAGAPTGLVAFTALPVLLARATLDRVEACGAGAKLTRPEVAAVLEELQGALAGRGISALVCHAS